MWRACLTAYTIRCVSYAVDMSDVACMLDGIYGLAWYMPMLRDAVGAGVSMPEAYHVLNRG